MTSTTASPRIIPKIYTYDLPLSGVIQESPDTYTYQFKLAPNQPFSYFPGQWAFLFLKRPDGSAVKRAFSFASSPTRPETLDFTIKLIKGEFTVLLEGIEEGHPFQLKGPFGEFGFRDTPPPSLVFIAGGTGVTPLMSMIRYTADKNLPVPMQLFYSVRTRADILYRSELEALAKAHPNLAVHMTLTRDAAGWAGPRGRISRELLSARLSHPNAHTYFVCGPDQMSDDVLAILADLGVEKIRVKRESWG